ncbi:hypothetical protein PU629_09350 [Pullulanibacillus sp. KACC 23026]|uniref:hypothetical protein n=1 Tax=Pullulanibacillus sp. KACC 23026 TaxID=3028315 RepID=UPI0023AFC067|nr:hypothetical protein [Pullulanibacillus sp. KACC 23026]WEG14542.1 hypothetical protein PU629_09350 [Pullulanibacillus sp. KACC 23026]
MAYNPEKISLEEASRFGIKVNFELMDNGQKRYKLDGPEGSSYCRTVGAETGSWQNSHYHKELSELYVVQFGWIVFAEMNPNGECHLRFLREGETVTVKSFVPHTIFMSSNAVTHTIKYGDVRSGIDWFAYEKLDEFTHKSLKSSY